MQLAFKYDSVTIKFELVYRERKNLTIKVEAPGKVTVIAPSRTSQELIIEKLRGKAPWIIQKLDYFKNNPQQPGAKSFLEDEEFMYLGHEYRLSLEKVSSLTKPEICIGQGRLCVRTPTKNKNELAMDIEAWYRQRANETIRDRINYYQPQIPKEPNRVLIKEQKKRWGSCSSKGNLNFNWKIIMAPASIVDYIVVHELCHLVFLNHSKEFWKMVATIIPDYKDRKEWLNNNGFKLRI